MNEIAKFSVLMLVLLAINASLADWYRKNVLSQGLGERTAVPIHPSIYTSIYTSI